MLEKIYESSIGIMPYSDSFLRKAVLGYQLFLLRKEGVADNICHVHVIVSVPSADPINGSIDKAIVEWFKDKLNSICNVIIKIGDYDCYNFDFTYS